MSKLLTIIKAALALLKGLFAGSDNDDNDKTPVEGIRIKPDWRDDKKPKN